MERDAESCRRSFLALAALSAPHPQRWSDDEDKDTEDHLDLLGPVPCYMASSICHLAPSAISIQADCLPSPAGSSAVLRQAAVAGGRMECLHQLRDRGQETGSGLYLDSGDTETKGCTLSSHTRRNVSLIVVHGVAEDGRHRKSIQE